VARASSPVGSILLTDLRLRLRRPATLWLIVILSGFAYLMIPDPATGQALMVVDGARALYTSQVVATTTAALAAAMLSFVGFYLTSNALKRDLLARTGGIIAATPVSSGAYLAGKWLGATAYLALVSGIYLLSVMAMHLLRGEGPLEPLTYLLTYLLILGPAIVVVAALALAFECVPLLSGRLGDVGYFFLWAVLLAFGAIGAETGGVARSLDVVGIGFVMQQVHAATGAQSLSIGVTFYNPGAAPWILPPLRLHVATLIPRLATALLALPALAVARLAFHRFDPARVRGRDQASGGRLIPKISLFLKPLTRLVSSAGAVIVPSAPGALRAILAETVMTLCQSPLVVVAWLGVLVATVVGSGSTVRHTLPLVISALLALALADLSTRDRAAGTLPMLFGMPGVKPGYARIKLGGALLLALLFFLPPALRVSFWSPATGLSFLVAAAFVAALATALGFLTRTPKTFMGVFLLFLYLVLNGAQAPGLDFAGWNGVATASTRIGYLAAAILLGLAAEGKHRWDVARGG
jgi:hypothetical protein